MERYPQITVIGDAGTSEEVFKEGMALGEKLADLGVTIITGGKGGVMEAVSAGAKKYNGWVVGILPEDDFDEGNIYNDVVIPTGFGHARNSLTVMAADIVIVIGGGAGTLTEMGFAWIYQKPVLALTAYHGWAEKLGSEPIDARRDDTVESFTNLDDLIEGVKTHLQYLGYEYNG